MVIKIIRICLICLAKLTEQHPQYVDYKLYHAQSLYNAFLFPEAVAVLLQAK